MPHYRCVPCKTRLEAREPDPARHECPGCGALLDPVADLSQLVGYRSVTRAVAAERWLGDGGAFAAEAMAVALPHPGRGEGGP